MMARIAGFVCLVASAAAQSDYRDVADGEVVAGYTAYAVDGIAGYTTWEVYATISGSLQNIYTFAGDGRHHPTTFPPAYQVAAPFGANTGGNNPAYWAYSAEAQYDSWVTVGKTDGSTGLGNIGVDFADWSETNGVEIENGAVFWMDPSGATPARATDRDAAVDVVLAHLTMRTGTLWLAELGELQGRSMNHLSDWHAYDLVVGNADVTSSVCTATTLSARSVEVQDICCGTGHRRSLQDTTCEVLPDECLGACAAVFVPFMSDCGDVLRAGGFDTTVWEAFVRGC